jgi:uncharacterized protein (TIGR02594 family)
MLRRNLLKAGLVAVSASGVWLPSKVLAVDASDEEDYEDYSADVPREPVPLGTHPATDAEERKALEICAAARGNTLIQLTDWFANLPDKNQDGHRYNAAWPDRWNPVIVQFYYSGDYSKKQTYVEGDTTPWCAAYLNWALNRLGKMGTRSASSGSFREIRGKTKGLGKETKIPVAGDIIVFKRRDANPDVGKGHVAIYVGETSTHFLVAGGNQYKGKKYSSVNRTSFPKDGYFLELASFRSFDTIPTRK